MKLRCLHNGPLLTRASLFTDALALHPDDLLITVFRITTVQNKF